MSFGPCAVCGSETVWGCADCTLDVGRPVNVCRWPECVAVHEHSCTKPLRSLATVRPRGSYLTRNRAQYIAMLVFVLAGIFGCLLTAALHGRAP